MIQVHESAKNNFNLRADALVRKLELYEQDECVSKPYNDDLIAHEITKQDVIGEIDINLVNGFGENQGIIILHQGINYCLINENYSELLKLVNSIGRQKDINSVASSDFLIAAFKKWIVIKLLSEDNSIDFIDFAIQDIENSCKEFEFWIPIPSVHSSKSLKLGFVVFKNVNSEVFNNWFNIGPVLETEEDTNSLEYKLRHKFQGYLAGNIKIKAEPIRAKELAYQYFMDSLSILRVFSPSNFAHQITCLADEYGGDRNRKHVYFCTDLCNNNTVFTDRIIDNATHWDIGYEMVQIIESYLPVLNEMLTNEKLSDLQDKVLNSLFIYSRSSLRHDLSDKILYILVALESLLLKNDNEPIQQNVGERIAFVMAQSVQERLNIVKTFKYIYSYRSSFVHHGNTDSYNPEMISEFLLTSWLFMLKAIEFTKLYESKDDFITYIETLKFS